MSNTIELSCEIFIDASPETVFSFLTEQDKAAQWFGEIVDIEGKPGGKFYIAAEAGFAAVGEYTEIIPHEKVVFTWGGMHDIPEGGTTVEITLKAENGGTRLTLRHYNIPTQEAADSFGHGWPNHAFPVLKIVAEGGTTDDRCFRARDNTDCGKEDEEAA